MKSVLINGFIAIFLVVSFGASDAFALATFNRMRCQMDVGVDAFVQIQVKLEGPDTLDVWVTTDTPSGTFFSPVHVGVPSEGGTVSVDWDTFPDLVPDAEGNLVIPDGVLTIPGDFVADGGIIAAHARYVGGDLDGQLVAEDPNSDTTGINGSNLAVCATKIPAQFKQQTKPQPDITVIDSANPTNFDPATGNLALMPFDSITEGTSSERVVQITNDGDEDLTIFSIDQNNAGLSDFSIVQDIGSNTCSGTSSGNSGNPESVVIVTPAASCNFTIRFSPTTVGTVPDGTFTITSDSPVPENIVTFVVTGSGLALPVPIISADRSGLSFGEVTIGETKDFTLTISNIGNDVLNIINVFEPLAPYSLFDNTCLSGTFLDTGGSQSCAVSVRFLPIATGTSSGSFDIVSDGGTVTVNLSGKGVTALVPDIDIQDSQGSVTDHTIAFGRLTAGQTLTHTVSISNVGTGFLEISLTANETEGTNPLEAPFRFGSNTCSGMLAPGEGCVLEVQFAPDIPGNVNDAVVIESNDPDEFSVPVSVSGVGLSPAVNNDPGLSSLKSPADGQQSVSMPAVLVFSKSSDPDGNPVHYTVHVCEDEAMTEVCITPVEVWETGASAIVRKAEKNTSYAGLAIGAGMVFGIVFIGGAGRRKKIGMFMVAMILAGTLLSSCSGGIASPPAKSAGDSASAGEGSLLGDIPTSGGTPFVSGLSATISGLEQGKTYYWKVIAKDDFGGEAGSEVWHFTT